ncbi:hypothetical protein GCM10010136_18910 [Limoniibacter endophyticus]|uniref:Uncharacterized protein n=1 Tax=Limoniibacter endophyticus TaxID=1565040 RepID=A0A8J3GHL5_9HYPH|nr:hypothetical protein GCM10010136_18910 [Limoniibacter endophyticus]
MAESRVGVLNYLAEIVLIDFVAEKGRQNANCEFRVGQAAHPANVLETELRKTLGKIEPAVARKARQDGIAKAEGGSFAAGGNISHGSLERWHLLRATIPM